ncbi:MAG TPA: DUF481 domain-containing protein [Polyangia bacterium]|jgi:hypothetical protein|nr:DUF481 domain-containing protein [Polyangia bacterium]
MNLSLTGTNSIRARVVAVAAIGLLSAGSARAQGNPTFTYGSPDAAPVPQTVEWKVQAKGGAIATTGNSTSGNATFGLGASRKEGNNKLALDGAIAYGRSTVWTAVPDANGAVIGLDGKATTTTNNWNSKGRYDRFFTLNNSAFISGLAAADKIAGKSFYGGGQIGYSRQVLKSPMHLVVAELGYDLSYERYVSQPNKTLDPVTIHSARVFVGETLKLSAVTGINASAEALFNLNKEGSAYKYNSASMPVQGVDALHDTRLIGKIGLTTTLVKSLSIGFSFAVKYDQNPAPRPLPPGTPDGEQYAPTFFPFADRVDTITEATLLYTFL